MLLIDPKESNRYIDFDEKFLTLPNIPKKRKKLESMIQENISGLLESSPHIPAGMKKEIKHKFTLHLKGELNRLAKRLKRNPFANYLGLQGDFSSRKQFCSEFILKHLEVFIRILNETINTQEAGQVKNPLRGQDKTVESDFVQNIEMSGQGRQQVAQTCRFRVSPSLLENELAALRQSNQNLRKSLIAKRKDNSTLITEIYTKINTSNRTEEEKKRICDQIRQLSLVQDKPNIDLEILELTTIRKKKKLPPQDPDEFLTKKIKGVRHYQRQLQIQISEANKKIRKVQRFLLEENQRAAPQVIFVNGMTIEQWREFIPYEDSPDAENTD